MKHTITLIPGDGIGPEVSKAVQQIIQAAGVLLIGKKPATGRNSKVAASILCTPGVLDSIRKNKVALKGPLATAVGTGAPSINVGLRKALDLYANLRPVKTSRA